MNDNDFKQMAHDILEDCAYYFIKKMDGVTPC